MIDRAYIKNVTSAKDFVGIKIIDNNVNVFVPEAFYVSNDDSELRKDLLAFFKSLGIAKTKSYQQATISKDIIDEGDWSINSYIWLIHDFIDNGFYYPIEKQIHRNMSGKIDWKKTMKTIPKIVNNRIIYSDMFVTQTSPQETLLTDIHKYCLKVSYDRIGWLFNCNMKIYFEKKQTIKEMKHIVTNALNNTFDDIKRIRFNHMIQILNNVDDNYLNSRFHTYGINHYEYVFEKMIDKMFGNINDSKKNKYYPRSKWVLSIDKKEKVEAPLEFDTLFIKNDYAYIIDSKLYGYGVTKNDIEIPNTTSIQKQITYGDYIYQNFCKNVRNIFILPYNKHNNKFKINGNLVYFGYAVPNWRDISKDYEYILGYFIDLNYLLKNYKKYDSCLFVDVEDKINKAKENN